MINETDLYTDGSVYNAMPNPLRSVRCTMMNKLEGEYPRNDTMYKMHIIYYIKYEGRCSAVEYAYLKSQNYDKRGAVFYVTVYS